jgi:hypothetical protein
MCWAVVLSSVKKHEHFYGKSCRLHFVRKRKKSDCEIEIAQSDPGGYVRCVPTKSAGRALLCGAGHKTRLLACMHVLPAVLHRDEPPTTTQPPHIKPPAGSSRTNATTRRPNQAHKRQRIPSSAIPTLRSSLAFAFTLLPKAFSLGTRSVQARWSTQSFGSVDGLD